MKYGRAVNLLQTGHPHKQSEKDPSERGQQEGNADNSERGDGRGSRQQQLSWPVHLYTDKASAEHFFLQESEIM